MPWNLKLGKPHFFWKVFCFSPDCLKIISTASISETIYTFLALYDVLAGRMFIGSVKQIFSRHWWLGVQLYSVHCPGNYNQQTYLIFQATTFSTSLNWHWPRGTLPVGKQHPSHQVDHIQTKLILKCWFKTEDDFGRSTPWTFTHVWSDLSANWRQSLKIRLKNAGDIKGGNIFDSLQQQKLMVRDESNFAAYYWRLRLKIRFAPKKVPKESVWKESKMI